MSAERGPGPHLQRQLEALKDLPKKTVLDALTCVECGRCQVNCPAFGAGKELNPKALILRAQEALLASAPGSKDAKLGAILGSHAAGSGELTQMLARLVPPSSGRVEIGEVDLTKAPEAVTGRATAYVCRSYACEEPATSAKLLVDQLERAGK